MLILFEVVSIHNMDSNPFTNILVIPTFTDGSVHFIDFIIGHPLVGLNILVISSLTDGSVHFMDFRTPYPPGMNCPFYWTS